MPALRIKQKNRTSDLLRRIILSWLVAVLIEYFILPSELRDLAKLDGLAQMSLVRIVGITCSIVLLLTALLNIIGSYLNNTMSFLWIPPMEQNTLRK